jgi:hypothetical protein
MNLQHTNRAAFAIAEKHDLGIDEACIQMKNAVIWLIADESIKTSYSRQISYLTTINIAHRVFLGGVRCILPSNTPNLLPMHAESLNELVKNYGGTIAEDNYTKENVKVLFGIECFDNKCIEVVGNGWQGGVTFYQQERVFFDEKINLISLGPIMAASIACYFAFCKIYNILDNEIELNTGISLWDLNSLENWHKKEYDGPQVLNMPRNIWTLGLGHLGQAYLWTVGLMPFKEPKKSLFLLQDADIIDSENIGSQILCFPNNIGKPKTRPCLGFLESLGFRTQIVEKPFIEGDSKQEWMDDYRILLNGVDNTKTRKSITIEQLDLFLDGATNGTFALFDSFTMKNICKLGKNKDELWLEIINEDKIFHKKLYEKYEKAYKCGQLTNIGISTPFVGLFGAAIVISELIRSLNHGKAYSIITLQVRDLPNMVAIQKGNYGKELLRFAL